MNIKKYREKSGISQMALAKIVGVSQQAVAAWESGKSYPSSDKLAGIAHTLGCTVDQIVRG